MSKYPKPCADCERVMRPNTPGSKERHPTAETVHHARGKCKACYNRKMFGLDHLVGKPVGKYDHQDHRYLKQPITATVLTRIQQAHPPTAHYILDRRERGIPTTGLRRKVNT